MTRVAKCESCGLLLCFKCQAHVDAPDQGLLAVCEECAAEICAEQGIDAASPGSMIHLEAYYILEPDDLEDEEDLPSEVPPADTTRWN